MDRTPSCAASRRRLGRMDRSVRSRRDRGPRQRHRRCLERVDGFTPGRVSEGKRCRPGRRGLTGSAGGGTRVLVLAATPGPSTCGLTAPLGRHHDCYRFPAPLVHVRDGAIRPRGLTRVSARRAPDPYRATSIRVVGARVGCDSNVRAGARFAGLS